jgi:hypothetical protein
MKKDTLEYLPCIQYEQDMYVQLNWCTGGVIFGSLRIKPNTKIKIVLVRNKKHKKGE